MSWFCRLTFRRLSKETLQLNANFSPVLRHDENKTTPINVNKKTDQTFFSVQSSLGKLNIFLIEIYSMQGWTGLELQEKEALKD